MRVSRVGGFVAACAIHGLLLAVVPSDPAVKLSSGGSKGGYTTLSISYQPLTPVAVTESEAITEQEVLEPLPVKAPIARPVSSAKPEVTGDTSAKQPKPIEQLANPEPVTQPPATSTDGDQGMHKTIITEPLFARQPAPPIYPNLARKRGQQGTVWIDVLLDKTGQQTSIEIYQSSGVSPLDRAALKAVKQWQFIAHHINDMAVASHIRIPVEFSLD